MKTWGADPELMLKNGNEYVSAIKVVPASPDHRMEIQGHEFYYDNVLAEFAMKPATSKAEALKHIKECLELYAEVVRPHKLVAQAYQTYPQNIWDEETENGNKIAAVAGCAKDACCYQVKNMKPPSDIIESTTERSGGGHVHLGDDRLHRDYQMWIAPTVVLMDLFIGVPSLFLDNDPTSSKRRSIYGQAGRHRICDYGLEYRTLGNFWLKSPRLTALVYDLCEFVCNLACSNKIHEFVKVDEDMYCSRTPSKAYSYTFDVKKLKTVINKSNKTKSGCELYDFSISLLPKGLASDLNSLMKGWKTRDYDMYKEWDL